MLYRTEHEVEKVTNDDWTVPHQHYKLTKIIMWKNGSNTAGFEVTFSPPEEYIGWSDIVHHYGYTDVVDNIETKTFTKEIDYVEICIDNYGLGKDLSDFEGLRFREVGETAT